MKRRTKVVVASVTAVLLLFGACAGLALYLFLRSPMRWMFERPETPKELREARVVAGGGLLSRSEFARVGLSAFGDQREQIGGAQDIAVGELDPRPGPDVVVAGRYGAAVFDRDGARQSLVRFDFARKEVGSGPLRSTTDESSLGDMRIIDIEGDGTCEYMGRGGIDGAAVFDHAGRRLWSYGSFEEGRTSIDDLAAGDLDGDGVAEFVSVWDKIEMFDRDGNRRWEQPREPGPLYQSEIVDADGDGKNEIVQSTGAEIIVRDARGRVLRKTEMPFYFSHFSILRPPAGGSRPQVLAVEDGKVWLANLDGTVAASYDAPLSEFKDTVQQTPVGESYGTSVYKSRGAWVRPAAGGPEFLAVVTNFAAIDRSVLYLYAPDGHVAYLEVLPEECDSLAVLPPAAQGGAEDLLVGGEETVWRYRWNG